MSEELNSQPDSQPVHPPNDFFANPTILDGASGVVQGSNVGATAEPNEPWHRGFQARKSVWYRWQSPQTDSYAIFTIFSSNFNSRLAAYTETTPGNDFSILAPVEPYLCMPASKVKIVAFRARAGRIYRIAVDGLLNPTGAFLEDAANDSGSFAFKFAAAAKIGFLDDDVDSLICGGIKTADTIPLPMEGVMVTLEKLSPNPPESQNTDAAGLYQFENLNSDHLPFTVTPSLAGHYFHPVYPPYTVPGTYIDQNYTGRPLLSFAFLGKQQDRVNRLTTVADGLLDGTFALTFPPGNEGEVVDLTLKQSGGGQWQTEQRTGFDILGVAYGQNDPLLNDSTGRVRFLVANNTIIHLFAADDPSHPRFNSGARFELTTTFADGRQPTVTLTI
jgi:hypothetical protein